MVSWASKEGCEEKTVALTVLGRVDLPLRGRGAFLLVVVIVKGADCFCERKEEEVEEVSQMQVGAGEKKRRLSLLFECASTLEVSTSHLVAGRSSSSSSSKALEPRTPIRLTGRAWMVWVVLLRR